MSHIDEIDPVCGLCGRVIPLGVRQSWHHLIPRLKGGRKGPTVLLHEICHNEIHSTFTEAELAREFNTVEVLRAHPQLAGFIRWVRKQPPGFYKRSTGYGRRRRK